MKYKTILFLIALGLIASIILSFVPLEKACGPVLDRGSSSTNTETLSDCTIVQTSKYETTLGFQNAHLGLIAFSLLFIITFLHEKKPTKKKKQLITLGLIFGSAMAIYFIYIQFFVLQAVCKYCMVTDIGILLSLGIILFMKDKKI